MSLDEQLHTIRHGVAYARMDHVVVLRIGGGDHAFDLLDAVCPRRLLVHDDEALHTLLLRDDGTIFADVYVWSDDAGYLLLAEGPTAAALIEYLAAHAPAGNEAMVEDLSQSHAVCELLGPYAWELLGELVGPEIYGIAYLASFRLDELGGACLRAGKCGEYAYDLLIPRAQRDELEQRVRELGEPFDLREASLPALDLCALENAFYCIRTPGLAALTPLELQLQWRLWAGREHPGARAIDEHRRQRGQRLAWCTGRRGCRELPAPGAALRREGLVLGSVVHATISPMLDACIGLALLDAQWAHSGLAPLEADGFPGLTLYTTSPPLLHNRSLFVDLHRHSYRSRQLDEFPPVIPERSP